MAALAVRPAALVLRAAAAVTSCNPDFNIAQLGLITRWTPVKNLTFSADLTYTMLDQKYAGHGDGRLARGIGKPAAVYELKDQNTPQLAPPRSAQLVIPVDLITI